MRNNGVHLPLRSWNLSSVVRGFDREVVLPIVRTHEALRILRQQRMDILIDVLPWARVSAISSALSGAEFAIGFKTKGQHRHFAYDAVAEHSKNRHELGNLRRLLLPLGMEGANFPRASGTLSASARGLSRDIVFHPWAGGYRSAMREWPLDRWTALARALIADGLNILITGSSADRTRAELLRKLIDRPACERVLAGEANLASTAKAIASSLLVVSVNTGVMHLAAATGTKLVALHGPTDPMRWGPLSDTATVIGPGRDSGGAYLNLGYEYPSNAPEIMSLISVAEVLVSARSQLNNASTIEARSSNSLFQFYRAVNN